MLRWGYPPGGRPWENARPAHRQTSRARACPKEPIMACTRTPAEDPRMSHGVGQVPGLPTPKADRRDRVSAVASLRQDSLPDLAAGAATGVPHPFSPRLTGRHA